jgi:hypothetical protein
MLGTFVLGFGLSFINSKRVKGIGRLRYLASIGVVSFFMPFILSGALIISQAAILGLVWLLILSVLLSFVLSGYLFGRLTIARSINAFGAGWVAIIGLVPIVNTLLLLWPNRHRSPYSEPKPVGWIGAALVISVGVSLFLASGALTSYVFGLVNKVGDEGGSTSHEEQLFIKGVRSRGVAESVEKLALDIRRDVAPARYPMVEFEGNKLTMTLKVSSMISASELEYDRKTTIGNVCGDEGFVYLLRRGAYFDYRYIDDSNAEIFDYTISIGICMRR